MLTFFISKWETVMQLHHPFFNSSSKLWALLIFTINRGLKNHSNHTNYQFFLQIFVQGNNFRHVHFFESWGRKWYNWRWRRQPTAVRSRHRHDAVKPVQNCGCLSWRRRGSKVNCVRRREREQRKTVAAQLLQRAGVLSRSCCYSGEINIVRWGRECGGQFYKREEVNGERKSPFCCWSCGWYWSNYPPLPPWWYSVSHSIDFFLTIYFSLESNRFGRTGYNIECEVLYFSFHFLLLFSIFRFVLIFNFFSFSCYAIEYYLGIIWLISQIILLKLWLYSDYWFE